MHLPHILLITDSVPHPNGGGISQTLYNLLAQYPSPLGIVLPKDSSLPTDGKGLTLEVYTYPQGPFRPWHNRLGKWVNGWLNKWYQHWQQRQAPQWIHQWKLDADKVIVLVSTTVPDKLLLAHRFLEVGFTVVPYFMDDWMGDASATPTMKKIHAATAAILQKAPARLMISHPLDRILVARYALRQRPTLIIHNPAPPAIASRERLSPLQQGHTIIYAGSIWPMHYDALFAVAKAIALLHNQGNTNYKLLVYTSKAVWEQHPHLFALAGVAYGGFIPYAELQPLLANGWLLLVTSAFLPAFSAFSQSSVQTKLTDYMAAAVPVLYVGPPDGASGQFTETHDIGFTIGTNHPEDIAAQLCAIAALPTLYERKAANAYEAATGFFSQKAVQERLYTFIGTHCTNNGL